jgi:hypothetical protein
VLPQALACFGEQDAFGLGGRASERSAAEKLDQLGSLPAAEPGERLCLRDPAVGKGTIGLDRTDSRDRQQQLAGLRRLRASWRVGEHLRHRDSAGGELSLQPRPCQPNLVRFRERAAPLLERARWRCRPGALNRYRPAIL